MMQEKKRLGTIAQHAAVGAEAGTVKTAQSAAHGETRHEPGDARAKRWERQAVQLKQLILIVYAAVSVGFGAACVLHPEWSNGLFSIWLLITFSLWLYLFLTMIKLLCDLQRLQKMREELYEVRYQEMFERLSQVRREFRTLQSREEEAAKK